LLAWRQLSESKPGVVRGTTLEARL
jgi:hypothetical protein